MAEDADPLRTTQTLGDGYGQGLRSFHGELLVVFGRIAPPLL
jgi:hypothetical protein